MDSNWCEFVKTTVRLVKYTCISLLDWLQDQSGKAVGVASSDDCRSRSLNKPIILGAPKSFNRHFEPIFVTHIPSRWGHRLFSRLKKPFHSQHKYSSRWFFSFFLFFLGGGGGRGVLIWIASPAVNKNKGVAEMAPQTLPEGRWRLRPLPHTAEPLYCAPALGRQPAGTETESCWRNCRHRVSRLHQYSCRCGYCV